MELAALERLKKSPLTYNGKDVVNTPALSFLIRSSSFLQVTRTIIRSRMSSKFSKIRPWTASCLPLSVWKMAVKCCEHTSAYIFDWIFFILSCNKDSHEILDEFDIRPWTAELAALERLKKSP